MSQLPSSSISLTKVHIQNYKKFKNFELNCNQLNCIIGKNGIGKTTILDAINQISNSTLESNTKNFMGKEDEQQAITFEFTITHGFRIQNPEIVDFSPGFIKLQKKEGRIVNIEAGSSGILRNILSLNCIIRSDANLEKKSELIPLINRVYTKIFHLELDVNLTQKSIFYPESTPNSKGFELKFRNEICSLANLSNIIDLVIDESNQNPLYSNLYFFFLLKNSNSDKFSRDLFTKIKNPQNRYDNNLANQIFQSLLSGIRIIYFHAGELSKFQSQVQIGSVDFVESSIFQILLKEMNLTIDQLGNTSHINQINYFKTMTVILNQNIQKYGDLWDDLRFEFAVPERGKLAIYYDLGNGKLLEMTDLSAGLQWKAQFLMKIYGLLAEKLALSIILIDEPGNNLHPGAQVEVMKFLKELAQTHQIWYTTHMPFLIDHENPDAIISLEQSPQDPSFIMQNRKNIQIIEELAKILEIPTNFFLFNLRNYIFVEGESDQIFFRHIIRLASENQDGVIKNIKPEQVISINGASTAKSIMTTFRTLDHNGFMIILDSDDVGKGIEKAIKDKGFEDHIISIEFEGNSNLSVEDLIPKEIFDASLDQFRNEFINISEEFKKIHHSIEKEDFLSQSQIISKLESKKLLSKVEFIQMVINQLTSEKFNLCSKPIGILHKVIQKLELFNSI